MDSFRVCMLDPLFYPYMGGTEKVVFHVGKRLAARGHEIQVLTSRIPNTKKEELIEGIKVKRISSLYLAKLPYPLPPPYTFTPTTSLAVLKAEADIFHLHNRFWYYFFTLAALKAKKKELALTLHNARPKGISKATDFFGGIYDDVWGKQVMRSCDGISAVSLNTRDITVPRDCLARTTVIYNGIEEKVFRPFSKTEKERAVAEIRGKHSIDSDIIILANARLVKQKGLNYLIDAACKLKADGRSFSIIIIGHGNLLNELKAQAKSLGVEKEIIFAGAGKFDEELLQYYNAADLFVMPSIWEPLGIAFVEAMACALPCVITDAGGMKEIAATETSIVPAADSRKLASALSEFIEDKKARISAGLKAREHVLKNLTWDKIALNYESFYKCILNNESLPKVFL
ncbi:MAG: glycosyltransferase family 4 protein [Candidatus Diapherotrites archaeon]